MAGKPSITGLGEPPVSLRSVLVEAATGVPRDSVDRSLVPRNQSGGSGDEVEAKALFAERVPRAYASVQAAGGLAWNLTAWGGVGRCDRRRGGIMRRLIVAAAGALALTFAGALPAEGSVQWVCDVPGEGLVTFVTAADAAAHGINQANSKAGQVFHDKFGEVCTVVAP